MTKSAVNAAMEAPGSGAAAERGHPGKFAITLARSSVEGFLRSAERRDLREQAYRLSRWLLLGLLGVLATIGHLALIRAYDYGPATVLAPYQYSILVWVMLYGYVFFGDFPDRWTFLGVAILIASAIYISVRERAHNIPPPSDFEQP